MGFLFLFFTSEFDRDLLVLLDDGRYVFRAALSSILMLFELLLASFYLSLDAFGFLFNL